MSWSKISRFGLSRLALKQHSLSSHHTLFSNRNQCFFSWRCYFITDSDHKRLYQRKYAIHPSDSFISMNSLIPRDLLVLNPVASSPLFVTQWRGLRGFPSNRTDKPTLEKIAGQTTHFIEMDKVVTGKKNIVLAETDREYVNRDQKIGQETAAVSGEYDSSEKLTLYQRFKKTYKEHGKVLVGVHILTSAVWFGSFYSLARCGFDIVPYLESWNVSDRIISPFRSGGLGDLALAYLMYKLATPARYTVTIAGTNLAIRYLRKEGKIPIVPQEDSVRSLIREGKEDFNKRMSDAQIRRLRRRNKKK